MDIAIWGCGKLGRYMAEQCLANMNTVYFIDNDKEQQGKVIDHIPVISAEKLSKIYPEKVEAILIGVSSMTNTASIIAQLDTMGIGHIGIFQKRLDCSRKLDWHDLLWLDRLDRPILPYLEMNIIDTCNLDCKGCTHFSNLFQGNTEMNLDDFQRDLKQVAQNVKILSLRLLGGEPLLNTQLLEYIKLAHKILPETSIHIVSNGLLIPKQNVDFFNCLKENNIRIDISLYLPTLKMKEKIVDVLEINHIEYSLSGKIDRFYRTINEKGNSDIIVAHNSCLQKQCTFLRHGRIYTCPYEGMIYKYIEYFHLEHFKLNPDTFGVDIYDESVSWCDLFKNLCKPIALCAYCSENGGEFFDWTVSAHPEKNEWLIKQEDIYL